MATADSPGAFGPAGLNVAEDALHVLARDQWSHFRFRIESIADDDLRARLGEAREKAIRDFLVENEP